MWSVAVVLFLTYSTFLTHSEYHSNFVNNTNTTFPPRFRHPTQMFQMEMKPEGSSIRFRCVAEGNPRPNISWYRNKVAPITRSYFQPSYGKWSMAIDELTKADNGNYTCVVCNELGCINHTVMLYVQERYPSKPYIKEGYPGNITVFVNDTAQLSCPSVSDLEPYIYWHRLSDMKEDAKIWNSDMPVGDIIETENPDDNQEQLTIFNVTTEDEGWYMCVAINSLGNSTAKGYLSILESTPLTQVPIRTPSYTNSYLLYVSSGAVLVLVAGLSCAVYAGIQALYQHCLRVRKIYSIRKAVVFSTPAQTAEFRANDNASGEDEPVYETIPEHVYETPGVPNGFGCQSESGARDISQRPPYPLPHEALAENQRYIHYDTPYEDRIFRFGRLQCVRNPSGGRHLIVPEEPSP